MVHTMLDSSNNETASQQCYQLSYEEEDTSRQHERDTAHMCIDKCHHNMST